MVTIKKIWFNENKIYAEFNDGRVVGIPVAWYPNLSKGNPLQWRNYEIWGENRYIHWPDLDEDISVDSLLWLSNHGLSAEYLPNAK